MSKELEIRNDDVLQVDAGSTHHGYRLRDKTPFEWFLWADSVFEEYNYPCILAVLSEGIDYYPKWVKHIKKHQHRYKIELHGSSHHQYKHFTAKEALEDLRQAKDKIEQEFNVKITTWYVPYSYKERKGFPNWGKEVCDELGIEFDVTEKKKLQYPFHYWHKEQVEKIHKIIRCHQTSENN